MADEGGVWRTISGRRVFIKDGQSLSDAMRESGKFEEKSEGVVSDFGAAHTKYSGKPDEAIDHLLKEQSGYVPAAINKDGIGDIDFVWGNGGKDGYGLAHIIERRDSQGIDGKEFIRKIPSMIKSGEVMKGQSNDRIFITNKDYTAVIRLDYDGIKATWLVTAYAQI